MNTTSLVQITPKDDNFSLIIIDAGYSSSLHKFLSEKEIYVTHPQEIIWKTLRVYRTSDGRIERQEEVLDMAFDARASVDQLESYVAEWISGLSS